MKYSYSKLRSSFQYAPLPSPYLEVRFHLKSLKQILVRVNKAILTWKLQPSIGLKIKSKHYLSNNLILALPNASITKRNLTLKLWVSSWPFSPHFLPCERRPWPDVFCRDIPTAVSATLELLLLLLKKEYSTIKRNITRQSLKKSPWICVHSLWKWFLFNLKCLVFKTVFLSSKAPGVWYAKNLYWIILSCWVVWDMTAARTKLMIET